MHRLTPHWKFPARCWVGQNVLNLPMHHAYAYTSVTAQIYDSMFACNGGGHLNTEDARSIRSVLYMMPYTVWFSHGRRLAEATPHQPLPYSVATIPRAEVPTTDCCAISVADSVSLRSRPRSCSPRYRTLTQHSTLSCTRSCSFLTVTTCIL